MGLFYQTNKKERKGRWYRRVVSSSDLTPSTSLLALSIEAILQPAFEVLIQLHEETRKLVIPRFISTLVTVYQHFFKSKNNEQLDLISRMKRKSRSSKTNLTPSLGQSVHQQMESDYNSLVHWVQNCKGVDETERNVLVKLDTMKQFYQQTTSVERSYSSHPESTLSEPVRRTLASKIQFLLCSSQSIE